MISFSINGWDFRFGGIIAFILAVMVLDFWSLVGAGCTIIVTSSCSFSVLSGTEFFLWFNSSSKLSVLGEGTILGTILFSVGVVTPLAGI